MRFVVAAAVLVCVLGACFGAAPPQPAAPRDAASKTPTGKVSKVRKQPAPPVDPRREGLEVGLGEWALTPEAEAIRPGRLTFVVENRGTMMHGFEIELEGDSSGPGSGDILKRETSLLRPGQSTRLTLRLPPGVYKIECLVEGHDDRGMEGLLEVRAGAPLLKASPSGKGHVTIADFAFTPERKVVSKGQTVRWLNDDPTEHTVTPVGGDWGSDALAEGETFSFQFDKPGIHRYRCAIHPDMRGVVEVE
ncbi:MAG: hypothetical protein ACRDKZ_07085 [Actinomycetota bacterium]